MAGQVKVGEVHESSNFGRYEVVGFDGNLAIIRFIETGYEVKISSSEVRRGQVKDWSNTGKCSVGKIFETNNCGALELLEYRGHNNVLVKFLNTGNTFWASFSNVQRGLVYDVLAKTVASNTGFIGVGKYTATSHKVWYTKWAGMLLRCYDPADTSYSRYGAIGITVAEEWHNFQNFATWCDSREDYQKGWELDKDIILNGNREYQPENCCFVPARINSLIIKSENITGYWSEKDRRWYFSYRDKDSNKIRKGFMTQREGQTWYAENKERVVKELAEIYKNSIDKAAYDGLILWKVYNTEV